MELSELTAYASEHYQIQEQHKWADFPGFSVLCHPQTGKWIALLMRQWDGETGEEIQRCDLKCGSENRIYFQRPYISAPLRMQGNKWINIAFDKRTEKEVVFQLFDRAVAAEKQHGYTIVLPSRPVAGDGGYQDTILPFAGSTSLPVKEKIPEKLREMRHLFEYGRETAESRAKNFYRQAVFMQDYEDDVPWTGDFICYFPTYQDLTTRQLRGYFTWRTCLRRGDYQPIATSAAYIYVYELLNGVGAATPEECLRKLQEFEQGYLDSGVGNVRMRANLRRWMLEYAVVHDLSPELAVQAADPEMMERDAALSVLRTPEKHTDEKVFSALVYFGGKKLERSPVLAPDPERGKRLFGAAWREGLAYRRQGKDLFDLCFGERKTRQWLPLSNTVYYRRSEPKDRIFVLNDCRSFCCRNGIWQVQAYEKLYFDRALFQSFLHESDALLRRYLKTGRYLKENPADEWAAPFVQAAIEADKKALLEAARPKITIDLSGLEQIRRDALVTRDSLLVEEETEEFEGFAEDTLPASPAPAGDIPLNPMQIQILRALLEGRDAAEIIRANHEMPSIAADSINEALFDEFGDTVILCEDDRLILVEDYIEDLEDYLGGPGDG